VADKISIPLTKKEQEELDRKSRLAVAEEHMIQQSVEFMMFLEWYFETHPEEA
jgi:hypothetical protein